MKHIVTGQMRAVKEIPRSKIKNWDRFLTEVKILQELVRKLKFVTCISGPSSCYQTVRIF